MGGNEELIQELGYLFVNVQLKSTVEEFHCQAACLDGSGGERG